MVVSNPHRVDPQGRVTTPHGLQKMTRSFLSRRDAEKKWVPVMLDVSGKEMYMCMS